MKNKLPKDEEQYKLVEVVGTHQKFKAEIIVDIQDEAEFIRAYCEKNNGTPRTYTANKNSTYYRCKHKQDTKALKMLTIDSKSNQVKGCKIQIVLSPWCYRNLTTKSTIR